MSWSAHYEVKTDGSFTEPVESAISSVESRAQFEVAFDAAAAIIGTKVLGEEKGFRVSLSGHANEGHNPVPGWSSDSVTINIYQLGEDK